MAFGSHCESSCTCSYSTQFSKCTLAEHLNAPRGASGESLANILRTEDTIPRLPRAVAELTRFRTGGELLFGESLLGSAGLSDVDFFIDGGCGPLFADNRRGLLISCWFRGLLLIDPVVFEFESIESLLFFCVKIRSMHTTSNKQIKYRYCETLNSAALLANGNYFGGLSRAEGLHKQLAIFRPNVQ